MNAADKRTLKKYTHADQSFDKMQQNRQRRKSNNRAGSLKTELWDKRLILGVPSEEDKFAQSKNGQLQISAEAYREAPTERAKAEYLSDLIDGLADRAIPRSAPKQCPTGDTISHLDPPQLVPKMLITPESPLRRLLVVQPPGSGKTCIMLDILANFLDLPYKIIIVGDSDIFSAVRSNLRKCPARVGSELLRDRNRQNKNEWCVLNSNARPDIIPPDEGIRNCVGEKFQNATIYWLDYVRFGNWLEEFDATSAGGGKKGTKKKSKYSDSPFSSNTLILMDEVHKLAVPGDEQATGKWKTSPLYIGKQLFQAGRDPSSNPIVVGFTATPIIDDPVQAICLATVFKGHTDPSIYTDKTMEHLRIPPKKFYDPSAGFVSQVTSITIHEPSEHPKAPYQMSLSELQRRLRENRCMQAPSKPQVGKKTGKSEEQGLKALALASHPCPVGDSDRAKSMMEVYTLRQEAVAPLIRLFSNLFFVVNTAADPRKFPEMISRQRLVKIPDNFESEVEEGARSGASWTELSNFANPAWLKGYVNRRLEGYDHTEEDSETFKNNAPKWAALARDLQSKNTLGGKTAVYTGARTIPNVCSSTDFLLGLAFYLQHEVGYSDGTAETFERLPQLIKEAEGQPSSQNSSRQTRSSSSSSRGPPLFIFADKSDLTGVAAPHPTHGFNEKDYSTLLGHIQFREDQLKLFNAAPCTDKSTSAGKYAIILLGSEAYKAIDLTCASNMIRLVVQPSGRAEQTAGRARRSCSFRRVSETNKWMVNLLTYVFESPLCEPFDCDCVLGSFYQAQDELQNQILNIMRGCSIGCTNFKAFSQWPSSVKCILDATAHGDLSMHQNTRKLMYCSFDGSPGAPRPPAPIKPGVSGDVSDAFVAETAGEFCSRQKADHIPEPSALDHNSFSLEETHKRSSSGGSHIKKRSSRAASSTSSTSSSRRRQQRPHTAAPNASTTTTNTARHKTDDDAGRGPPPALNQAAHVDPTQPTSKSSSGRSTSRQHHPTSPDTLGGGANKSSRESRRSSRSSTSSSRSSRLSNFSNPSRRTSSSLSSSSSSSSLQSVRNSR